ncbi:MAG: pectin esterase [Clostridia bacterium]|nr:pectin esterase [Clostridia bacterium]
MKKTVLRPEDNLQKALANAQKGDIIHLKAGIYRQKVLLRTDGIVLEGEGAQQTAIVWDDYALKKDENGVEYNTFRTWTMAVCADSVCMRELAIINDALQPEKKGQAVALSVLGDDFRMENCRLSSMQDTLFAGPLPADLIERYDGFLMDELRMSGPFVHKYIRCLIEGSVDFIFGCADALFDECEIRSVHDIRKVGYVAAPAHAAEQQRGFLFRKCRFTCDEHVPEESVYLARPWRDFGFAQFEDCSYQRHIAKDGFDKWNDTHRDKTARFYEKPPIPGRVEWVR